MLYTEKTIRILEFDKIREMLASCAATQGAKAMAIRLTPTDERDSVVRRQKRTSDARRLLEVKGTPPFGSVTDVSESCERAEKGAALSTRELLDVASLLYSAERLVDYIKSNHGFDTLLDELFDRLIPNRTLREKISRAIISEDMIADEASPTLGDIRRNMRAANNKIKDILQKYVSSSSHSKYLQENIVTMRNGRYVIPVKSEYKNEVKGMIHDSSASGATVFIEPAAVVDANNELRILEAKESHEIEKILFELSARVGDICSVLIRNYMNITEIAFIFACAELSMRMRATEPIIVESRSLNFKRARHPLIDKEKVVPIDVSIGNGYDTLVITGPNTGGKTVTLKTLGLFALMVQAGLHIPADETSEICIFDRILADIGDEQSIEQSLSTFSSHMTCIVGIMQEITDRSLVLFDELGVGTDPIEGAALAVAVTEAVREAGAMCASTSHYAEMKAYALNTEGVSNASCEFDVNTLKPTYRLIIGMPGKSNAFAISTKLGLPESIVSRARELVNEDDKHFEDILGQLESTRLELDREKAEMRRMRTEYEVFKARSEKEINEKLAAAAKEVEVAKNRASAMVESARASSEFIFAELEKAKRAKESEQYAQKLDEARRAIRANLRENEDKFNPVEEIVDENYVLPRELHKGDDVYIINIGKYGVLTDDPDRSGNVTVKAGIISTRTKISNLKLIENRPQVVSGKNKKPVSEYHTSVSRDFKPEIDLRGMNGEEAWLATDKYLDEAQMLGFKSVHLIHGKGTGALKVALWNFLKTDKRIKSYRIGQYGEGDGGVTVVELK